AAARDLQACSASPSSRPDTAEKAMAGNPPSEQPPATPTPAAGCPGHDELVDFARGRLPPDRGDALAEHLKGCPGCEAALAAARGDSDSLLEGPGEGPTRAYRA